MTHRTRRIALLLTFVFALLPLAGGWAGGTKSSDANRIFDGNVMPLAEALAKSGTKIDADTAPYLLVLRTSDGRLHPVIKDEGSRMFFKDAKLLNRPMRLTARLVPNSPYLQVITVHSLVKEKLHDIYYWCDVCVIKRYEAGICDCCGDAMVFREEAVK
ncbi:MAG: hypothetical protein EXS16_05410 [Gemmataceae bacterium]|nr:hypothetical protein [Gemmataceae bacterium]